MVFIWAILGQNRDDFWPKSYIIWYILESKIQEYFWILAQKFKLDDLPDFVKIQFLNKNMTFDTVWRWWSLLDVWEYIQHIIKYTMCENKQKSLITIFVYKKVRLF